MIVGKRWIYFGVKERNRGGEIMNHDYAHCSDYRDDCPKECFRGELVRDLKANPNAQRFTTWSHLYGTDLCMKETHEKLQRD